MAQVQITIAGRDYSVSCADGEEKRIQALGRLIDGKLREGADVSALSETRALLYAALFLADEVHDLRARAETDAAPQPADDGERSNGEQSAKALENLADRVEAMASRLENGSSNA